MRSRRSFLALSLSCALALVVSGASRASSPGEAPAFMRNVFAPELVMQNAREIGLRAEQRSAITKAIQETQARTVELQWEMQEAAGDLAKAMGARRIDEETALAAVERVMQIEGQVKRAHLGLLIRIKNQLDGDQQEKLAAIRDRAGP